MDQTVEKPKPILDYKDLKDSRDIIKLERAPILQFGVHRAACSSFGDEAPARLCQIIVESNKAFLQEVLDNKVDLLDIYENEELLEVDDLGISLPFLALYFDRPEILRYLYKRGIDLSQPCDPMGYGNVMFYAVCLKKYDLIPVIHSLDVSAARPCNNLNELPLALAKRLDDPYLIDIVQTLADRDIKALTLFKKNWLRLKARKEYLRKRKAAIYLQNLFFDGFFRSNKYLPDIPVDEAEEEEEGDGAEVNDEEKMEDGNSDDVHSENEEEGESED